MDMNEWIRRQTGRIAPDVQAEAQAETAQPRADGNAGSGAAQTGIGRTELSMTDRIRNARYGRGPTKWTTYK